jgi:hypothetical protein
MGRGPSSLLLEPLRAAGSGRPFVQQPRVKAKAQIIGLRRLVPTRIRKSPYPAPHFLVYMKGAGTEPTKELNGRKALTPVFDDLNRYQATTHFNGQSTVALDGDRATAESYCLAHHLFTEKGTRKLMAASLRYLDSFVEIGGAWLFAERELYVDWTETRQSQPQRAPTLGESALQRLLPISVHPRRQCRHGGDALGSVDPSRVDVELDGDAGTHQRQPVQDRLVPQPV